MSDETKTPRRFTMWCAASHHHELLEDEHGNLIAYSDYAAKEREAADLRAQLAAKEAECVGLKEYAQGAEDEIRRLVRGCDSNLHRAEPAERALAAATQPVAEHDIAQAVHDLRITNHKASADAVERLARELSDFKRNGHKECEDEAKALKAELSAERTAREAAQRDAERYLLLRNGENWPAAFGRSQDPEPLRGIALDMLCDAARGSHEAST